MDEANSTPSSHSLANILGIEERRLNTSVPSETETDFNFVRENIKDACVKGNAALDEMLIIAQQSQHPRSFEVFATLLRAVTEANKTLIDAKKTNSTISEGEKKEQTKTINNNLFVGSTSELQKFIEERKKNENP